MLEEDIQQANHFPDLSFYVESYGIKDDGLAGVRIARVEAGCAF